jgi:hypothetical protein
VQAALAAIDVEPLRERAQPVLLETHIGVANWVEARRGFVTYRDLVRRELGAEPSYKLAEIFGLAPPAPGGALPDGRGAAHRLGRPSGLCHVHRACRTGCRSVGWS